MPLQNWLSYIEKACPSKSFCSSTVTTLEIEGRSVGSNRKSNGYCPFGARCPGGKQVWAGPCLAYRGMAGNQIKRWISTSSVFGLCWKCPTRNVHWYEFTLWRMHAWYYNRAVGPKTCFPCPDEIYNHHRLYINFATPLFFSNYVCICCVCICSFVSSCQTPRRNSKRWDKALRFVLITRVNSYHC